MLLYGSAGALNLSLAYLVLRLKPQGPATRLVALLALAGAGTLLLSTVPAVQQRLVPLPFVLEAVTFLPLLALPFLVPWRRLGPRGERAVLAAGGLLVAFIVASTWLLASDMFGPQADPRFVDLAFIPFGLAFGGIPALGALVLLDGYLGARDPVQRDPARMFLAAYALKVGAVAGLFTPSLLVSDFGPIGVSPGAEARVAAGLAADVAALVAMAALPLALAFARRPGGPRAGAPLGEDAFVLGMVVLGVGLGAFAMGSVEYLVLRPALLAYGILQYRLLDVEAREHRAAVGVAVLAAMGAVFMLAAQAAGALGADPATAAGAGFAAALAAAGAFGWPMLMLVLPGAGPDRRLLIYRAALEAASREGREEGAFEALRPLRQELGVSDREHAQALAGAPGGDGQGGLRPGGLFLGRYRVVRELGRGAAGEVLLARDERLGRQVAVKRLGDAHRRDAAALAMFHRETRLASTLQHPNIVAVYDVETVGSDAYLVMEYVAGGSLEQRLQAQGPLPEAEAVALDLDLLDALAALHARGIVHRDVKPSNLLLDEAGRAKLADFTVARETVSGETVGLTRHGAAAGTPAYMAPEQARGLPATERSDVYAAGAVLYAALAGRPPVDVAGLGEFEARLRVAQDAPAMPLPGASEQVNAVLAQALARDPAERYPTAEAMARALRPAGPG